MQKTYTPEEIREASNIIGILNSVAVEKRITLRLVMECILLGANITLLSDGKECT